MKAVNLLPADQRTRSLRVKPTRKGLVGVGLVAAVAGVGYWGFTIHQQVGDLDAQISAARTEQTELQAQVGAFSAIQQHRAVQERKKGLVVGLTNARVNWERIIRDTATVMPRQAWLTALKAESPGLSAAPVPVPTTQPAAAQPGAQNGTTTQPAPAPVPAATTGQTPSGLHLTGNAYNHRQVAIMMVRLGAVAGLGEPKLTSSTVEPRGGRNIVQFQIDVPIDQRSQDRPTLSATGSAVPTSTPVQP
jgi:Tfp pilus assembly protein PilN